MIKIFTSSVQVENWRFKLNFGESIFKELHAATFEKLLNNIGWIAQKISIDVFHQGEKYALHSFSLNQGFVPLGFPGKVFNEATSQAYYEE